MSPIPSMYRATTRRKAALAAGIVSVVLWPAPFARAQAAEPLASVVEIDEAALCPASAEPPAQCSAEEGEPLCFDVASAALDATSAATPATEVGPRSLRLAAASRVTREESASHQSFAPSAEVLAWSAERPRGHFDATRSWPLAVGLTADALSTYWALQRGAVERNPLLSSSGFDVAMAKMVQFPLLILAVDSVERKHPKLGRQLRWATLAFHAALAFNNVRLGLAAPGAASAARSNTAAALR